MAIKSTMANTMVMAITTIITTTATMATMATKPPHGGNPERREGSAQGYAWPFFTVDGGLQIACSWDTVSSPTLDCGAMGNALS